MADSLDQINSAIPDGWAPDGIMAGIPDLNAAAGQSTLGAVMTPEQIADAGLGTSGGNDVPVPTPRPPYVTSSEGGNADALTGEIKSLDPSLSPVLGQLHWVAVPNSVDQDDAANINPDQKPRGYPDQGYGSNFTYGDLGGTYDPVTKDVIIATGGGHVPDGSYNTVLHETGHGIDALPSDNPSGPAPQWSNTDQLQAGQPPQPRYLSDSDGFKDAYGRDANSMTQANDSYYLNPSSGRSEAYAESFARYFGGDPTLQQKWPGMYDYWATRYPNASPAQSWNPPGS